MAQVVNHQPFTIEAQFQSSSCSCGVHGGQNGSRAGSSPSTSICMLSPLHLQYSILIHLFMTNAL